jgi:hypothetical protein
MLKSKYWIAGEAGKDMRKGKSRVRAEQHDYARSYAKKGRAKVRDLQKRNYSRQAYDASDADKED